jgi:hypothetical protein
MKLIIERNTVGDTEKAPYTAVIEILNMTIDDGTTFNVPIYTLHRGQKKMQFFVEICGFRLETDELSDLPILIKQLLNALINVSRLPSYVFIARSAGGVYPVYTINNEVLATTPGGPVFRHVELAKVREYLTDYLHDVDILGERGLDDKLHVRGINMKTLGLRRPVFYLKKRVSGQTDFWAPVFESGDGKRIYTYAADARREVPISAGQEVIFLREIVAQALLTDGRLEDLHDLRPDRLQPPYWQRLHSSLRPEGGFTVNGVDIALYANNYVWIGVETRHEEERYSLFVGRDAANVQRRVQQDFDRRGIDEAVKAPVNVPALA